MGMDKYIALWNPICNRAILGPSNNGTHRLKMAVIECDVELLSKIKLYCSYKKIGMREFVGLLCSRDKEFNLFIKAIKNIKV